MKKQTIPSSEPQMTRFPNGRKTRAFTYEEIIPVAVGIHKPGNAPRDTVEEALGLMREALRMENPEAQRKLMMRNALNAPLEAADIKLLEGDFQSPLCRWERLEPVSAGALIKEVMDDDRRARAIQKLIDQKEKALKRKVTPKEKTAWTKQLENLAKQQVQRKAGESSDPVNWILEKAIGSGPANK